MNPTIVMNKALAISLIIVVGYVLWVTAWRDFDQRVLQATINAQQQEIEALKLQLEDARLAAIYGTRTGWNR